ncbi:MAG: hypothetical protein DCO96_06095 [Fluviicola sp. XM-24bin1]|nr:MAG: hypothetical protein DCO96_06095 [Fluviicola sp. XM-24bin1]
MRLALTICSILIGSFIASAQPNSKLTLETELFSIEFPDLPEFDHDTLDSKDTLISYSHTVDHDSITYSIVHRNRTEVDNKTETFDAEIDWLGYWTLADISDKTKSKLNGFPTLRFTATTSVETIYFYYVLTDTYFIRVGASVESVNLTSKALAFIDSFSLCD